jgi:hypothetical protein
VEIPKESIKFDPIAGGESCTHKKSLIRGLETQYGK